MTSDEMVNVNLDIAGFYFRQDKVSVPEGATVQALMEKVKAATKNAPPGTARFSFDTETLTVIENGEERTREFLDSISVTHQGGTAISGQNSKRVYDDGIYAAADEKVLLGKGGLDSPLIAAARNATGILAWQFYIYDKNFVDLNRKGLNGSGQPRKVVPFTEQFSRIDEDGNRLYGLQQGDTVVWRLIQIRTRPGPNVRPLTAAELAMRANA